MGGPSPERGCGPQRSQGFRPGRESERPIVPRRPGNAGGGKGPYFWGAFEEAKGWGIGMSLVTPEKIRRFQRKLYDKAKREPATNSVDAAHGDGRTMSFSASSESSDSERFMWVPPRGL